MSSLTKYEQEVDASTAPAFADQFLLPAASVPIISSVTSSNSVTVSDGTVLEDIDAVIFATGYEGTKPTLLSPSTLAQMAPPSFVDVEIDEWNESEGFSMLYKALLAPSLPSMAIAIQSFGPGELFVSFLDFEDAST